MLNVLQSWGCLCIEMDDFCPEGQGAPVRNRPWHVLSRPGSCRPAALWLWAGVLPALCSARRLWLARGFTWIAEAAWGGGPQGAVLRQQQLPQPLSPQGRAQFLQKERLC